MMRLTTLVWVVVLSVSAFALYKVKFQVQTLRGQITEVERELERERESLNVVAAEWAYLNRPARLKKLADEYLSAQTVTAQHVAEVQAIPFPPVLEAKADSNITPVSQTMVTPVSETE